MIAHVSAAAPHSMPRTATARADLRACALLLLVAAVLLAPLFWNGPPAGHSSHLNWGWARGFADALREGALYPRWLANMSGGRGSPAFYFYGPVPFYLTAPFLLALPAAMTGLGLSLGQWLILALSGVACYALLRQRAAPPTAAIAAALYMAAPYHYLTDIWIRSALAEQAAFIWLPLCALFAGRIGAPKAWLGLAAAYTLLILSHLPSAVLAGPFIAVWVVCEALRVGRPLLIARGAAAAALSLGLAAIYLLPALLTQDFIHADQWWTAYYDFRAWMLLDPGSAARPPLLAWIEAGLGAATLGFFASALVVARDREAAGRLLPWAVTVAGAWFLMTPVSTFLWANIPPLAKVQFPWRAASLVELAFAVAAAEAIGTWRAGSSRRRWLLAAGLAPLAIMLAAGVVGMVIPYGFATFGPGSPKADSARIAAGTDADEYLPRWAPMPDGKAPAADRRTHAAGTKIRLTALQSGGQRATFRVHAETEQRLVLPVYFYPAWQATIDGAPAPLLPEAATGLASVLLPPGEHVVALQIAPLRLERLGAVISGFSLALLIGCLAARHRRATMVEPAVSPVEA